ncbi:MAG TPA: DUF6089 family protein [Bacteroidales bacterium]|nr:DUF6089 family protein [Bacteroidales bacterium]
MKTIRLTLTVCLLMLAFTVYTFGQENKTEKEKYNTWSVSLSGGSMLFYGDLRQFEIFPVTKQSSEDWYGITNGLSEYGGGIGITLNKQFSPVFSVQGMLEKGTLAGFKAKSNAHFNTDFFSYGINVRINFIPLFNPNAKSPKFSIYGITGLGLCNFKTMQTKISNGELIHSYGYGDHGQEKRNTEERYIPVGAGIKYKINNKFDIGLESTLKYVNTDKLDGRVKENSAKDMYGYTALTVTYQIGKNIKSKEWTTPKEESADDIMPILTNMNKKIDSLGNKLKDADSKVSTLQNDVKSLKNPATEADDDGDGVPNNKDLEPNTPKGNLINFQGITIPKVTPATSTTSPATTSSATDIATEKPLFSIYFRVNSDAIDANNKEKIAAAAVILKQDPSLKMELIGHADKTGGKAYNELLSKKRAQAVYDLLVNKYGIDGTRLIVKGVGINDPVSNDVLSFNRRVDFIVKK